VAHEDQLVEGAQLRGQVILHHGDPAYTRRRPSDDPKGLPPAEALFLRIVAYLAFAERVCIPGRYILANPTTFDAVALAEPLLALGLLRPERRAEAASFEELAGELRLGEDAHRRGAWLDQKATHPRSFRSLELGDVYRAILRRDLAPLDADDLRQGGLRRALRADVRRGSGDGLDRAYQAYAAVIDRTPEAFFKTVAEFAPHARGIAQQWAMARYYLTPTIFDTLNTRELPQSAAALLVRGRVLDAQLAPADILAPVDAMYSRLSFAIQAHNVRSRAREYCEALLMVRERVPRARDVFADVANRAEIGPVSAELAELMRVELNRQYGVRRSSGHVLTLVASLVGAGAGLGATIQVEGLDLFGLDPKLVATGVSAAAGIAGGVAGNASLNRVNDWRDRRRKPWVVAIDRLAQNPTLMR
jgi:hypothetical protein